jgi:hypothetical protein
VRPMRNDAGTDERNQQFVVTTADWSRAGNNTEASPSQLWRGMSHKSRPRQRVPRKSAIAKTTPSHSISFDASIRPEPMRLNHQRILAPPKRARPKPERASGVRTGLASVFYALDFKVEAVSNMTTMASAGRQ